MMSLSPGFNQLNPQASDKPYRYLYGYRNYKGSPYFKRIVFPNDKCFFYWYQFQQNINNTNNSICNGYRGGLLTDHEYEVKMRNWLEYCKKFQNELGQSFVPRDMRDAMTAAEILLKVPTKKRTKWEAEKDVVQSSEINMRDLPRDYEGVTDDLPNLAIFHPN